LEAEFTTEIRLIENWVYDPWVDGTAILACHSI